ncbi:MAG: hypothetical protein L6R40_004407 [Gallowayella cf. fulva]|nr:MAG: hypothetical protein L6R40_004407 [Xanthomendoza cf. fulva]
MSSPFAARRRAKIIRQDEGDEDAGAQAGDLSMNEKSTSCPKALGGFYSNSPVLHRWLIAHAGSHAAEVGSLASPRSSSKSRKKASSRISFGTGGTSMTEDEEQASSTFTVKKSNLSRQAIEKNALRRSMGTSLDSQTTPLRNTDDRPSYSAEYLNELKTSTPSTPRDLVPNHVADSEESKAIDLAAKFGSDLSVYESSAIPTDAEIQEKKQRRARLAKEEEYINLHGSESSDDDRSEITLRPRKDRPETRLVHDDEDVMEGFDELLDDGRIALGRRAEREQKRKQKSEMQALINEAEGGSSSQESDDSEVERRQAYEAAQTRAGMDGLLKNEDYSQPQRPRTPPKITPLPTLNGCLEKLQAKLNEMQRERMLRVKMLEEVQREKQKLAEREIEIQRLLKETGDNYARLRSQVGGELAAETNGQMMLENGTPDSSRGLENLVTTPAANVEMKTP